MIVQPGIPIAIGTDWKTEVEVNNLKPNRIWSNPILVDGDLQLIVIPSSEDSNKAIVVCSYGFC